MENQNKTKVIDLSGATSLVVSTHGTYIANPNDIYIGRSLIEFGEHAAEEINFLKSLCKEGDCVLDVGANIGVMTIPLAKHVGPKGTVMAIEANPGIFYYLCGNIAINGQFHVQAFNIAASDSPGVLHVPLLDYTSPANFGGLSLMHSEAWTGGATRPVRALPIDMLCDFSRLDLLKIDVEGMESAVLRGSGKLIDKNKPIIYIENDRESLSADLISQIFSYGYMCWWHTPKFTAPSGLIEGYSHIRSVNMVCAHHSKSLPESVRDLREVTSVADRP